MKSKKIIYSIIVFLVLVAVVFIWNNYRVEVTKRPIKPIKLPTNLTGECGVENCHGLDITCGPNVPEMCTMEYQMGDFCRQYARCEIIDGKCQLAKNTKFEDCKSCIKKCEEKFSNPDNQVKFSQCESECRNKTD